METKKLPVGIESFVEMRSKDFYYVDKTSFIHSLLNNWGKVNLFTRPRRFGKTLNMSMLQAFFEIGEDHQHLFDGLAISKEKVFKLPGKSRRRCLICGKTDDKTATQTIEPIMYGR